MKHIPGFRTRQTWKMIVAGIYYLVSLTSLTQGFMFFLFVISLPFAVFYTIDFIKLYRKRKTLTDSEKKNYNLSTIKWVAALSVVFIAVASFTSTGTPSNTTASVDKTQTTSTPTAKPTTTETQKATTVATTAATTVATTIATTAAPPEQKFSDMEVTTDNIKIALKGVIDDDKLVNVDITQEKGKTIVDVYFNPGLVWDEKDMVKQTARSATAAMEVLFTNPKIDKIWFWGVTKMTDPKGNEKDENVINVSLTKENAKEINWPKFKDMVTSDYKSLFNIADDSFIYPSIAAKLD